MKHRDSFSLNSPFGYLIKNNGKNILDVDYNDSFIRPPCRTKSWGELQI